VLRISVEGNRGALWLVLEGRLVGPWVDELQKVCEEYSHPGRKAGMIVDLCGLTAMDSRGQRLLDGLLQRGATLRCSDVMNQYLVEQMARPTGHSQEACRPCRRFPSQSDPAESAAGESTAPGRSVEHFGLQSNELIAV